jgi:hypothetical protein
LNDPVGDLESITTTQSSILIADSERVFEYLSQSPQSRRVNKMNELLQIDRLKEWEAMEDKNELAHFCSSWAPIAPNAMHLDPRLAGFRAIFASYPLAPWNSRPSGTIPLGCDPVNPV